MDISGRQDTGSGAVFSDSTLPSAGEHPHSRRTREPRGGRWRRAGTACQQCRRRKARCDNAQPCGSCRYNSEDCTYADRPSERSAVSTTDELKGSLLDRLSSAISLLESIKHTHGTGQEPPENNFDFNARPTLETQTISYTTTASSEQADSAFANGGFGQLEVSDIAARVSSCEAVLQWPIVHDTAQCGSITSFPLQSIGGVPDSSANVTDRHGLSPLADSRPANINENDIFPLCRKFVRLIHTKNPVLNVSDFMRSAREVAENGPGWNGQACLVLLACALASIAFPYSTTTSLSSGTPIGESLTATHQDVRVSEAYATAARKRLGLIDSTMLSAQCLYFAGLYEKFMMRPFSAWKTFQRACVELQAYLYAQALNTGPAEERRPRHLEQRLYWSCVRGESELRAELQLPISGLPKFKYPDLFPYLSLPTNTEQTVDAQFSHPSTMYDSPEAYTSQASPASVTSLGREEECSWLYYLAEISLRKLMNRVLEALYSKGEQHWENQIHQTYQQYTLLKADLADWRKHLPEVLSFADQTVPDNELALFLKTRYLSCMQWLHQPFLYHILHSNEVVNHATGRHQCLIAAQECLQNCTDLMLLIAAHHRHGGVWALLRKSFACAVLLLAATTSPLLNPTTDDLQPLLDLTLRTIRRWNYDSVDLTWMQQTFFKITTAFGFPVDYERIALS